MRKLDAIQRFDDFCEERKDSALSFSLRLEKDQIPKKAYESLRGYLLNKAETKMGVYRYRTCVNRDHSKFLEPQAIGDLRIWNLRGDMCYLTYMSNGVYLLDQIIGNALEISKNGLKKIGEKRVAQVDKFFQEADGGRTEHLFKEYEIGKNGSFVEINKKR